MFKRRESNRRRSRSVNTEVLETRTLLTGNVIVAYDGTDLTLLGDNVGSRVQIEPAAGGFVVNAVAWDGGTTVNGQASVAFNTFTGIRHITANMKGGQDWIDVRIPISGSINAKMGSGTDTFKVESSVAGNVVIKLQGDSGGGTFDGATVAGNVQLLMGGHKVAGVGVNFEDSHIGGNTTIKAGRGNHSVDLKDSQFDGDVNVSLGGGLDRLFLRPGLTIGGDIFAHGGGGKLDRVFNESSVTVGIRGFEFAS